MLFDVTYVFAECDSMCRALADFELRFHTFSGGWVFITTRIALKENLLAVCCLVGFKLKNVLLLRVPGGSPRARGGGPMCVFQALADVY